MIHLSNAKSIRTAILMILFSCGALSSHAQAANQISAHHVAIAIGCIVGYYQMPESVVRVTIGGYLAHQIYRFYQANESEINNFWEKMTAENSDEKASADKSK